MIDTIVEVLAQVPPEHRDDAERDLLSFASEAGHKQVAALGARIVAHLDPDGAEPVETEPSVPTRELSLRRKRSGVWELNGRFDDETGARASALLDVLAQRRTADDGGDFRSPQERYGDAFSDAIDLALNTPDLPTQAGERAHVMVAISLEDLRVRHRPGHPRRHRPHLGGRSPDPRLRLQTHPRGVRRQERTA